MNWSEKYGADHQPAEEEVADFIETPLWKELNDFLQVNYEVEPAMSYSTCSGQPGWNIKYQKAGRSLCTLYPMPGFFIALVVIGGKEMEEMLEVLPECSEYVQTLFGEADLYNGTRWLMISVTSERILQDVERLIQVRRKIKKVSINSC